MHDADAGNPPAYQSVHALPIDAAALAAAAQRLPPVPSDPNAECLKPFPVAGNRVIVEVALHDRPQPLPRLRNRIVHPGSGGADIGPFTANYNLVDDSELVIQQGTGTQSFPRAQIVGVSVKTKGHRLRNTLIGLGVLVEP
jgi:hypothetical protein